MATIVTRYVDPDSTTGGDGTTDALTGANRAYVSLSAALAAEARNLVTADEICEIICCSSHANHTADTALILITTGTSWVTDSTRYITIKPSASARHSGVYGTSKYRIEVNLDGAGSVAILRIDAIGYVKIDGLQIFNTNSTTDQYGDIVRLGDTTQYGGEVSNCIIRGQGSAATSRTGINTMRTQCKVWNNIVYDVGTGADTRGISICAETGVNQIFNNTVVNCYTGVYQNDNTYLSDITNNLVDNCTVDFDKGWSWGTNNYNNASSDATAPGTDSHINHTFTFAGSGDYHLASNDTGAIGLGLADPGSGLFSDDIDGQTRGATWDIGADQYFIARTRFPLPSFLG